ncbi:MAG TPA: hypothetical protein VNG32_04525 [Candidatus Dormibacteraeota bacterium]|nr:hypothetical protein [Candidatus Dormibacteraeota bacterium]
MRVRLSTKDREYIFSRLDKKGLGLIKIASVIDVSPRTITDWKRGKYNMTINHFDKIVLLAEIDNLSLSPEVLDTWWNNSAAGKQGAAARFKKHGQLGDNKSRRLGGKNSYLKRKDNQKDIYSPKSIIEPAQDERLAEFIGILIGDGGVTKYQVAIASNTIDDREYIVYIISLIRQLFGIDPSISVRKNMNCTVTVISSVNLVKYLKKQGVPVGDKLRQNLDIPAWILRDRKLAIACLRGIFDTDGGVYLETHKIKGKQYSYPRLAFVSMSPNLRASIHQVLTDLEFSPKIRNNRSVNLEKRLDIRKYFGLVGTSNPKHMSRWDRFGGVG